MQRGCVVLCYVMSCNVFCIDLFNFGRCFSFGLFCFVSLRSVLVALIKWQCLSIFNLNKLECELKMMRACDVLNILSNIIRIMQTLSAKKLTQLLTHLFASICPLQYSGPAIELIMYNIVIWVVVYNSLTWNAIEFKRNIFISDSMCLQQGFLKSIEHLFVT